MCFDTGGLDIKPAAGMLIMKKDMGGAASVLALAHMVMDAKLKVRLRVLIPAVENAISGDAFRPRDVYASRKGLTVEIGNTDAEGRLVLADALALADEESARAAGRLGHADRRGARRARARSCRRSTPTTTRSRPTSRAMRAAEQRSAVAHAAVAAATSRCSNPRSPTSTMSAGRLAGSITAALFLNRFVTAAKAWAHFDIYAWTPTRQARRVPRAASARPRARSTRCSAARYG